MSGQQAKEISEEIYHRIYRLIKRRVNAHTIAATLHLPVRTVLGVISRLERSESSNGSINQQQGTAGDDASAENNYLDIYFYPKTRYAILDLVGVLSEEHTPLLKTEIQKVIATSWKAIAIRMSHVQVLCDEAAQIILSSKEDFTAMGRYMGILDPAPAIEQTLAATHLEDTIPIFGTERAFEDAAFAKKGKLYSRHGNNPAG
ncbi:MAG: anti-sigma factor antagonist [Chitinispirillaceae bacterium]|nr:anti-sigma factor antagonist [Chitinispirillaceae bacterium]